MAEKIKIKAIDMVRHDQIIGCFCRVSSIKRGLNFMTAFTIVLVINGVLLGCGPSQPIPSEARIREDLVQHYKSFPLINAFEEGWRFESSSQITSIKVIEANTFLYWAIYKIKIQLQDFGRDESYSALIRVEYKEDDDQWNFGSAKLICISLISEQPAQKSVSLRPTAVSGYIEPTLDPSKGLLLYCAVHKDGKLGGVTSKLTNSRTHKKVSIFELEYSLPIERTIFGVSMGGSTLLQCFYSYCPQGLYTLMIEDEDFDTTAINIPVRAGQFTDLGVFVLDRSTGAPHCYLSEWKQEKHFAASAFRIEFPSIFERMSSGSVDKGPLPSLPTSSTDTDWW